MPFSEEGDKALDDSETDLRTVHAEQLAKFHEQLKPLLKKYPNYDTDFALLRWLRGSKFDEELAIRKMKWALNTMEIVGAFDKDLSSVEKIHKTVRDASPVAEYFPGGNFGYDKNGYVIFVHNLGKLDPRSLIGCGRVSEFYISSIFEYEGTQCLIRSEEARRGRKLGTVVIIDLAGFSYDVIFHIPATKIYMSGIMMLQEMYPDSAIKLYLINAPLAVYVLVRMVQMILAKETLEQIEVLGSDWKEVFIKRHGAENLPKCYGGMKNDDFLRKGGIVPDSVKAQINKKYLPPEKLTKIAVCARELVVLPIKVDEPNSKLSWYFTCSSGDIDFCILFEGNEVWPRFRISTEFIAEFNEITCKKAGIYEMVFSNKHGRLWTKHIEYRVDVSK